MLWYQNVWLLLPACCVSTNTRVRSNHDPCMCTTQLNRSRPPQLKRTPRGSQSIFTWSQHLIRGARLLLVELNETEILLKFILTESRLFARQSRSGHKVAAGRVHDRSGAYTGPAAGLIEALFCVHLVQIMMKPSCSMKSVLPSSLNAKSPEIWNDAVSTTSSYIFIQSKCSVSTLWSIPLCHMQADTCTRQL